MAPNRATDHIYQITPFVKIRIVKNKIVYQLNFSKHRFKFSDNQGLDIGVW